MYLVRLGFENDGSSITNMHVSSYQAIKLSSFRSFGIYSVPIIDNKRRVRLLRSSSSDRAMYYVKQETTRARP